ncbi:MAG: glycosyltransferase [Candidatus Omnitrophica bacterium]|nr:glycosyltransferase [Candidatus Omnitrophota bacterium]
MKVSVIVPSLNEAGAIEEILRGISRENVDEILVIDGNSTDGTIEIVKGMGYRLLMQSRKGLGNAIQEGIKNTNGEIIIIVDADGSHETRDIPKLVEKIKEGYDLVVGSRYISGPGLRGLFWCNRQSSSYDDTFIRELGNRIFTYLCRKIYHLEVHDILMGFKAFRREIFKKINLAESGQQFDAEIIIKAQKAGFKIGEVPTTEHKRTYGKSKLSVPYHGFKVLWVVIREMFV